jgi:Acetyltransferase (GNAT) family
MLQISVLGKAEGTGVEWHGHITALTVAPEYRRLSLARKMTSLLEMVSEEIYKGFFVDLYVRCANVIAIGMYEGMGYSVYRRVREYYGTLGIGKGGRDDEDAFGMSYLMCSPPVSKFASRHAQTFGARPKPSLGAAKWEGHHCKRTRRVINIHTLQAY